MSEPNNWQVILVEDLFDDTQFITKVLNYSGITVFTAQSGVECLSLLDTVQPTLIITDLAMPNMDGWQTLAAIRADQRTRHVPVVAVTAYHSAELVDEAIKLGFDGYFPKPIPARTFVQSLQQIIG